MLAEKAGFGRLIEPAELLVRELPAVFGNGAVEVALHQGIDVAVREKAQLDRFADHSGIGFDGLADLDVGILRQELGRGACVSLVGGIDAECLEQRAIGELGVIGHPDIVFGRRCRRSEGARVQMDVERERRLKECGVAAHKDRREECHEKRQAKQDRCNAIGAEAPFGCVTACNTRLHGLLRAGRVQGFSCHRGCVHSHYSYCSLYLRTM